MAAYYPYPSNQTEILSFTYIRDDKYLPRASSPSSYREHISNSQNFEYNDDEQNLSSQALSLSLGTQFPPSIDVTAYEYQYEDLNSSHLLSPNAQIEYDFEVYKSSNPMDFNSKYMKAAQELLDEVISVQKNMKHVEVEKQKTLNKFEFFGSKEMEMKTNGISWSSCDSNTKAYSESSPLEREQLKVKLGNICSMVDEVDKRYRKYCHQMQIVVSSFDAMAGHGAARSYTTLPLCTISRQFRCLRDSLNKQIMIIRQSLGGKNIASPSIEGKLIRLRIVDQQLRQQSVFQQFGVTRNSWRPQRGLPGNSVSVLRAWLFEHFLHPYPKDSEKIMLSRQTGLTRGQVANWFINARVRLWKPMVEEMYKEEFGDTDTNSSPDPSPRTPKENIPWASIFEREKLKANDSITEAGEELKTTLIPSIGLSAGTSTPLEQFSVPPLIGLKGCTARLGFQSGSQEQIDFDCKTMTPKKARGIDISGLGTFTIAEQVSLALGLEQGQNDSLLIASSETQFGEDNERDYHCVDPNEHDIKNQNLLPDFV